MQKQEACANLNEVSRGEHLFKINSFSSSDTVDVEVLTSAVIAVGGYDWQIRCHPRAHDTSYSYSGGTTTTTTKRDPRLGRKNDDHWVMFDLTLVSDPEAGAVFASLTCSLVAAASTSRWRSFRLWRRTKPVEATISCSFMHRGFVSRALLLVRRGTLMSSSSEYLTDDSFTVRCAIAVVVDQNQRRASALAAVAVSPSPDMHQHLAGLLETQKGADVNFAVSGESFLAHTNILAARSPVFMAEFFGNMKESSSLSSSSSSTSPPQRVVEIEDVEPAAFRALLHFIYTDTLPPSELDRPQAEAIAMSQHLAVAGDRYGMERLKLICEERLRASINVETVATTLVLAEQQGLIRLKDSCVEFIVSSPRILSAVADTQGYQDMMVICPSVVDYLLMVAVRRRRCRN